MICDRMYGPDVDGLCGNDDAGQMSAWYLFSALGFYPVAPASGEYALGSPAVKSAIIHLGNGQDLIIETEGNSTERYEVETVYWNSVPLSRPFIDVNQMARGGTLKFVFKES